MAKIPRSPGITITIVLGTGEIFDQIKSADLQQDADELAATLEETPEEITTADLIEETEKALNRLTGEDKKLPF